MKFIDEIEKLQQKNKGCIVLVKNGIFFTGIGKDAIILNKLLGLQLTCMKENLCKVGFSAISIEKYLGLLALTKKSFVIYDSKKKNGIYKFEQIYRVTAERIYEENKCNNCNSCIRKKLTLKEIIEKIKEEDKKNEQ